MAAQVPPLGSGGQLAHCDRTRAPGVDGAAAARSGVALAPGEVHVWFATQPVLAQLFDDAQATLDAAERQRAARFVFDRDRQRFVHSHAWLRQVLAAYAGCMPSALAFEAGPFGKPSLGAPAATARSLCFSLSHAGDGVAIAVARGMEVGVDIEPLRAIEDRDAIARRLLAPHEARAWERLDDPDRERAFLRLWTRKEAFVKGVGQGLSYPLEVFGVGWADEVDLQGPDASGWTMCHLEPDDGHVGAVAVRHPAPAWRGARLG